MESEYVIVDDHTTRLDERLETTEQLIHGG